MFCFVLEEMGCFFVRTKKKAREVTHLRDRQVFSLIAEELPAPRSFNVLELICIIKILCS